MYITDHCYCAALSTKFPEEDAPIFESAIAKITCDRETEENCRRNCFILAEAANDRTPLVPCRLLGNYNTLRVSVHSRTSCKNSQWIFTGLSMVSPRCCQKGTVVRCKTVSKGSKRNSAVLEPPGPLRR
ncbi:hypothetical protein ILUMI_03545 [Ignelater luminosus]|uniref:Uncharacterized protein n=1 Tax=Ignelater luminosus TaxID=2038154 RepID=A0A8K0DG48_IGNLU|nr:hypothetical protein ILUMI_03545 [Ignelater luminosus]